MKKKNCTNSYSIAYDRVSVILVVKLMICYKMAKSFVFLLSQANSKPLKKIARFTRIPVRKSNNEYHLVFRIHTQTDSIYNCMLRSHHISEASRAPSLIYTKNVLHGSDQRPPTEIDAILNRAEKNRTKI